MRKLNDHEFHPFTIKNRHFVLDVERSFLYSIKPEVYQEITGDLSSSYNAKKLPFYERWVLKNELRNLKRKIRPLSEEKKRKQLIELEEGDKGLVGIWLGVSHACNLGCSYCFANNPAYLGRNNLMSINTALKAIDFLIDSSLERKYLTVIFFGGEPLMNLPVITKTVAYCREKEKATQKRFRFSMTTNGTLLTRDVFETLQKLRVYAMVSMDGVPEIHNKYRKTRSGKPSWNIIVNNLKSIPDFGDYIPVRATVMEDDIDLVKSLKKLRDIGFKAILFGQLCSNSGVDAAEGSFRIEAWKRRYDELVDYCIRTYDSADSIPLRNFQNLLNNIYIRSRLLYCCATGRYYYYINPDGEIYPCARLITNDSDQKIGTLDDTPLIAEKTRAFFAMSVYRTTCRDCWARYLCGGPCFGDSFFQYGDFQTPDYIVCGKTKYLIYCAAYILDYYRNIKK